MVPQLGDRSLFPSLEARVYANHASISPPSRPVQDAVAGVVDDYARRGVNAFLTWNEHRDALRETLAGLLHAEPDSIAFSANTTRGLTDIALCMPWQPGDRVLLTRGEFPANVTPWQRAAELYDLEIAWLPAPTADNVRTTWQQALERELAAGVRLVALSAVQFQTGLRMPLREIGALCAAHDTELCVDAIQALGAVPIDVRADHIHYLAAGSHKWLMGLEGIALVYVEPGCAARLRPVVAGWLSHDEALRFLFEGAGHLRYDRPFQQSARMLEGGMYNTLGCAALTASVDILRTLGVDAIFAHVDAYNDQLADALLSLGFSSLRADEPTLRSGAACFHPPGGVDVVALHEAIDPTEVSCAIPDGVLRFSPHWPNHTREIAIIVEGVERALHKVRGG